MSNAQEPEVRIFGDINECAFCGGLATYECYCWPDWRSCYIIYACKQHCSERCQTELKRGTFRRLFINSDFLWMVKREGWKVYARDGNVLYQCGYCTRVTEGKTLFFAIKKDLQLHIQACHSSGRSIWSQRWS